MPKEFAYIKKLYIKNFKKFDNVEIEFGKGINILVGANNAGKTTILEALDIILSERNLAPGSVSRRLFNNYEFGKFNEIKLIAEIHFPKPSGQAKNEIDLIKQLKLGKGGSRAKLPRMSKNGSTSVEEILSNSDIFSRATYEVDSPKKRHLKNIYLVTEITLDSDFYTNVDYKAILNLEEDGIDESWQLLGLNGSQRSNIVNYLFLNADRINNPKLTEINEFNWIGRYVRGYILKEKLLSSLNDDTKDLEIDSKFTDKNLQTALNNILSFNNIIKMDIFNNEDIDSVLQSLKFFIDDGFKDEIQYKSQGVQSSALISLFLAWSMFKSKDMPRNTNVHNLWNTLLTIEEPESHFHLPLRNKLIAYLKTEFVDQGAQIILSTHDSTFVEWQYSNIMNLIFPSSRESTSIKTLEIRALTELHQRLIRFNGKSLFSDFILLVEGCEEICLDQVNSMNNINTFSSLGVSISRCVGGTRSSDNETQDKSHSGGKDDLESNVTFYDSLHIKTIALLDIDALFLSSAMLKRIYKKRTGNNFPLEIDFQVKGSGNYKFLKTWWKANISDSNLKVIIAEFSKCGIFFFPGDFEALFSDEYLLPFEVPKDSDKLIKEKHVYAVKYDAETNQNIAIYDEQNLNAYKQTVQNIEKYIQSIRQQKKIENSDILNKPLDIKQAPIESSDLPF